MFEIWFPRMLDHDKYFLKFFSKKVLITDLKKIIFKNNSQALPILT